MNSISKITILLGLSFLSFSNFAKAAFTESDFYWDAKTK